MHIIGVGLAITDPRRRVLLSRTSKSRMGAPGGRVELGEGLLDVTRREALEECGQAAQPATTRIDLHK